MPRMRPAPAETLVQTVDLEPPLPPTGPLTQPGRRHSTPAWLNGLYAGICLYFFLCAINVMGSGLGLLGRSGDFLERMLAHGNNPFIALMGSVLITATVQSSSFTTALIVTLVATGDLSLGAAIFAIMGANIGTSVTGIIVSLGNMRIRRQFRRAFTAALMHDIFNLLSVALLFPLEWISSAVRSDGQGFITLAASKISGLIGAQEISNPDSPVKVLTRPVVSLFNTAGGSVTSNPGTAGTITAVCGLVLLFVSLALMVKNLRGALLTRLEGLFRTYFFRNDGTSFIVGIITTVLVQSSSITTSIIVPLAGAGVVKLKRVFAFMLGANLGTTITGLIAASADPKMAAVTVAIFHVLFNLIGTAIWYPARRVPIGLAKWYGRIAADSKRYAVIFLLSVFIVIPGIGLVITELLMKR